MRIRNTSRWVAGLLAVLAPLLTSAFVPLAARTGAAPSSGAGTTGTVTVGAESAGDRSSSVLDLPAGARIVSAELRWSSAGPAWCWFDGGAVVIPDLWAGAVAITADRVEPGEHGATARADVTELLPAMLGADGETLSLTGFAASADQECWAEWALIVVWSRENPAIAVDSTVAPAVARPGQRVRQSAVVGNTGDVALRDVTATFAGCRRELALLQPGDRAEVRCELPAPASGELPVEVSGTSPAGEVVTARTSGAVRAPAPEPAPSLQIHVDGTPHPTRPVTAVVRVSNTSAVPVHDVAVTGSPASCAHRIGELAPGRTSVHRCRVGPGESIDLVVSGRSAHGVVATAELVVAPEGEPGTAVAAPPSRPPAPPPPPPEAPVRAAELTEVGLVRESPARAAGFIAVLGVLVMMVSVGALSAATRVGR
ncbi:hypothetical protein [Saccharopolyspora cebuensis]|uniref:Uncharacterized protein n=1 Tax=Saccharopolyspora cebuensis TaxID=418759 RepID=A0ABV4CLB9_9PSEU